MHSLPCTVRHCILCLAILVTGTTPAQRPALIGYYAGDGSDLLGRDLSPLTHVIWCFLHLQGDSVAPLTPDQQHVIRELVERAGALPGQKFLLSFGGWGGCATCSEVFARDEGRRSFAASLKVVLENTGADGIDLDWEYPAVQGPPGHPFAPEDKDHFTELVRTLRAVLGDGPEISFAVGGTDACIVEGFDWPALMPLVDRVHLMSYDLVHGYSARSGHHTPLYSTKEQIPSTDHAVRLLLRQGVPRGKLVIGAAFYDRIFQVDDTLQHGLYRPGRFDHAVPHRMVDTTITVAKGWTWYRDTIAQAAYAFDPADRLYLTGDDRASLMAKCAYVREQHLAGIMFWQIRDDKSEKGSLDTMGRALRGDE